VCVAYLDEVLALGLGHQRLQLGCGEGVDEARLRHDEQQHLGARQDRELVGLAHTVSKCCGAASFRMRRASTSRAQL
jgi:hypothetical protein